MRQILCELALGGCGEDAIVFDFDADDFGSERHVYKHVLKEEEGWSAHVADIAAVRARLRALGCHGDGHGRDCPRWRQCDVELGRLVSAYRGFVIEAFEQGATLPRHAHSASQTRTGGTMPKSRGLNYFLSERGVIVEAYEDGATRLRLRTAYRRSPTGRPLKTDREYFREARLYVCDGGAVQRFCVPDQWRCDRIASIGDILRASRTGAMHALMTSHQGANVANRA